MLLLLLNMLSAVSQHCMLTAVGTHLHVTHVRRSEPGLKIKLVTFKKKYTNS